MASATKPMEIRPSQSGGSGAGLRRPAERTMAAQPRGVIETAERSSRTESSRGRRAAPNHHQKQKQQTDMNRPEDVIRWPGSAAAPAPGDSQMWSSCRAPHSPPSEDCEVGYYSEQVGDEEENAQAKDGHGKQILSLQSNSVQVTYYRQQRETEAARRRLSSGGDCGLGGDTRRGCGECCTTRTRAVAEARTPTRHSFASNCMEGAATTMLQLRRPPLLVTVLLCTYLMLSSLPAVAFAARQQDVSSSVSSAASTNCTFPQRWEGTWFQSGLQQPIVIKGSKLSFRGTCIASDGDKFLMADDKCRRCVVIYEKHKNVLQYKESECDDMYMDQSNHPVSNPLPIRTMQKSSELSGHSNSNGRGGAHPNTSGGHSRSSSSSDQYQFRSNDDNDNCFCRGRESLQNLCEQIPGDALLYSMFKENAEPVKCPLKGPFTFTYNRGHGECGNPVSNIESCTEDSRLLLSFQACPDVVGTERTVEELTCLATWKDGNSRYLVGLVSHHHATSNEERYRCFVYEKIAGSGGSKEAEYKLAQSGDATCNGLDSAEVGSRIMTLRKAPAADRCDFPQWFKGRKHWHSIMGNYGYAFHQSDGSMHITKSSGMLETRALCEQINKQTSNEMMAVVHYTTGCQSGFMCMVFYRRDTHVAEIQMGSPAQRLEDACAPDHFDINKLQFVTLLASNPESEVCPIDGLYGLRGAIGPPYIPSRHKRNHNQRSAGHTNNHSVFGHDTMAVASQQQQQHRRHIQSSFRSSSSSEQLARHSWKSPTRGVAVRNRRDTEVATLPKNDTRVRRDANGCVVNHNSRRQLLVGCTETNVIEVRPYCTEDNDEVYTCHGSWTHNGTQFIVAKHVGSQHGVCMSYRTIDTGSAQLIIGDVCLRSQQMPMEHHLVANLSVYDHTGMDREGKCSDTNRGNSLAASITSCLLLIIAAVLLER